MRIYELSYGGQYAYLKPGLSIDLRKEFPKNGLVKGKGSTIILKQKSFYLLLSKETVELGEDEVGIIFPKSTISRLGLIIPSGVVNPGFKGKIVIEVYNASYSKITIRESDKLAKMLVLKSDELRGLKYDGRYQMQNEINISLPI